MHLKVFAIILFFDAPQALLMPHQLQAMLHRPSFRKSRSSDLSSETWSKTSLQSSLMRLGVSVIDGGPRIFQVAERFTSGFKARVEP